ncbi:MAG: nicotinamide mononucleotide transporter [Clostridia bacterium]|nr:nicotinamide mononucleotide transporter [Clostridia bacterium]
MKLKNSFRDLTKFERTLWLSSVAVVVLSSILVPDPDMISAVASLIGVTALIFVAKGYVLGQLLTIAFSVLYGIVSWNAAYYGEMITYLGMSAPAAVAATIAWLKNPYKNSAEVEVARLSRGKVAGLFLATAVTTVLFYFLLGILGTSNLPVSTVSVTTSFLAATLLIMRSPFYALAYAANDVVLIVLWIMEALSDPSCAPMIACFTMFLFNDLYGFLQWTRMQKRQSE